MFKWALLFMLIATSFSFSRNPASMTTTLSQLNQELEQKYIKERKRISTTEFRALRTRLNLEVSSAQNLNDRENEIFKLLSYSTYAVFLTRKSDQIKTLKSFWDKLFKLPINSEGKALSDDFFGDLRKPQNYYDYIQFLEFYTDFFPQEKSPVFVFDFIRAQCEFYSEFRVEKKFYPCLKRLEAFVEIRPSIRNIISNYELNYLSRSKQDYAEFLKAVSRNFQVSQKRSTIHIVTLIRSAIYEALEGNTTQAQAHLDELKNTLPGSPFVDSIGATVLFVKGEYAEAKRSFAAITLPGTETDENARYYYSLGAALDVALNEYASAIQKLKKHMEMTQNTPLHGLRTHLSLLILEALSGTTMDAEAHQKLINRYESIIHQLKLQDPYLKISLRIMKTLLQTTPLSERMGHLKGLHKEFAAHELKFALPLYTLSKLIEADAPQKDSSAPSKPPPETATSEPVSP